MACRKPVDPIVFAIIAAVFVVFSDLFGLAALIANYRRQQEQQQANRLSGVGLGVGVL